MPVPTKPGLWWRGPWNSRQAVEVALVDGTLKYGGRHSGQNKSAKVEDDGKWLEPLSSNEEYEFYDWCSRNDRCCLGYNHNGSCRDIDRD